METLNRFVAGIDVHKKMLAVVVRREQDGQTQYEKHRFGATRSEIASLAAWLQHQQVVMESTAQVLAAGVVRVGRAFSTTPDPFVEDASATGAQARFPRRATAGGPVAVRRSGGELHSER